MIKLRKFFWMFFCPVTLVVVVTAFASGAYAANKTIVIPLFSKASTPKTEYVSIGSEAFVPGTNVDYKNTYGCGGASLSSGFGALVAPVHMPHGAVVTNFEVFFDDTSKADMTVVLQKQHLASCGYIDLAQVHSSGTNGYYSGTDSSIENATIDNRTYTYHIYAYSNNWDSNLQLKGVVVTYTTQ